MADETPASPTSPLAAASDATTLLDHWKLLTAIGEPVRYRLLRELADGTPRSVNDLAARVQREPDATSKHLRVLRDARLVLLVSSPDGDGRKQFHQVPAPFRTRDAAGHLILDFGAVLLRFD
jgi:DNA-binding transcriptional ArsR family regulator